MSFNVFLLVLAIIFFVFAAFNFTAVAVAWQWLGFACWAASGFKFSQGG